MEEPLISSSGPTVMGNGQTIDARGSHGAVINPQGPVTQYFYLVQRYPFIKDYIYDVSATFTSATEHFVGRDFVFQWLETQWQTLPCGYLRLIADAGLGKTAIAAEAARRYAAIIHFNNAAEGITRPDQCLNHLSASLIAWYHLPYDHLPERAGQDANFLQTLLEEAAAQRRDQRPLLLVIDALDEATPPSPGSNWLHLPGHLPRGVYILLTQRPGDYGIATDAQTPQSQLVIQADDSHQQEDIRLYLTQQVQRPALQRALAAAEPPVSETAFVARLQTASEGNFMYLSYVLAELTRPEPGLAPLNWQELPPGLVGYYQRFWAQLEQVKGQESWESWSTLYRPVIELLGAAQEPVTAEWLAAHTGRTAAEIQERALARWQRFLRCEQRADGALTWQIIHRSFADFLAEKVDLPGAHRRIADHYLERWGGLAAGLPGLLHPASRDLEGGYGLRHLVAHLSDARRWEDLSTLLSLDYEVDSHPASQTQGAGKVRWQPPQPRKRIQNLWYTAKAAAQTTASYLLDVERVWRQAEAQGAVALQSRCALLYSSVRTIHEYLPADLLAEAVKRHKISLSQALTLAWQRPEAMSQAAALKALAPLLAEQYGAAWSTGALSTLRQFQDRRAFLEAVTALLPYLPVAEQEPVAREALVDVRRLPDEKSRVYGLLAVARFSETERAALIAEALDVACGLPFEADVTAFPFSRVEAFRQQISQWIAERKGEQNPLSPDGEALALLKPPVLTPYPAEGKTALRAALLLANLYERCKLIGLLLPYAQDDPQLKQEALAAGRSAAHELDDAWRRRVAWSLVIDRPSYADTQGQRLPRLSGTQEQVWEQAVQWARQLPPRSPYCYRRIRGLIHLWPHLPSDEQKAVLQEITAILSARKIAEDLGSDNKQKQKERLWALLEVLPYLPPEMQVKWLPETLALLGQGSSDSVGEYLLELKPLLAQYPRYQPEALALSRRQSQPAHAQTLTGLLPVLTPELSAVAFEEAWTEAQFMHDDDDSGAALALNALAPYLPEPARSQRLEALFERGLGGEYDFQGYGWAILTPRLPAPWRERALKEALAGPAQHAHKAIRALTLKCLAPYLPSGWVQLFNCIMDDTPNAILCSNSTGFPLFSEFVAGHPLLELRVGNSLTVDRNLYNNLWLYYTVLIALWPRLPEDWRNQLAPAQLLDKIDVAVFDNHPVPSLIRLKAFSQLARSLSAPLQEQTWASLEQLATSLRETEPDTWTLARGFGVTRLPEAERVPALRAALQVLKQRRHWMDAVLYTETFLQLCAEAPPELGPDLLAQALEIESGGYESDAWVRALALSHLAPQLIARSPAALQRLWLQESEGVNVLHSLAQHRRSDLLAEIGALAPVIHALGGEKAIAQTIQAIQDVRRWWP